MEAAASAEELKAQGNKALTEKDFPEAIRLYSKAIELDPSNHVYFSNRSAAHLSAGDAPAALADGEQCVGAKIDWPKGHNRKGAALHRLGRLEEAAAAYMAGLEVCPEDPGLVSALKTVSEALGRSKSVAATETGAEVPPEEWKVQVEEFKTNGNAAFKAGNHQEAIRFYSMALELDPANAVLYSNRSAAFLASGEAKSKALVDAAKCVELRPDWAKGHSRLGAAQHSLGRFDAAIDTYKNGLRMYPSDKSLANGLAEAKKGQEKARVAEVEKARREYEAYQAAEAARKAADQACADDLMDNLFGEIAGDEEKRAEEKREAEALARREKVQTEKTDAYTKQSLGSSVEQVGRLVETNYKFRNLNPYWVLQLDIDATVEDIKFRYKKLSLLVHPDKNLTLEDAQVAFDELKRAYEELLDEEKRDLVIETIETARAKEGKEHRKLVRKGMKEDEMKSLEAKSAVAVAKAFADIELRRRDTEKHLAASRKRERDQEDQVKSKAKAEEDLDKNWTKEERVDDRINDWRGFQTDAGPKKSVSNYKQQERGDSKKPKFGAAEMESWKKAWK
mmetsp:Transcript_53835/g.122722  ORF Transcript_53835/g.122722 Transcript_53835/m.122722 type:complete len:565 (+) Transcript_53835:67-1761(+)